MNKSKPEQPIIKIDYKKIPSVDLKNLFRSLARDMARFYEDPKNCAAFEAWKKEMEEEPNVQY